MKVDIEGSDLQALQTLTPSTAPSYVSVELNAEDPTVEQLTELGYSGFKFVDGENFTPPPIFDHQAGWRFLRKAGRIAPFVRSAIASLPQRYRAKSEWYDPGKYSPGGYAFTAHSSGPFGEQAAGVWMSPAAALRCFRELKHHHRNSYFWWDLHARHFSR